MDSEDELLCALPAVIIRRKKTTKKKGKKQGIGSADKYGGSFLVYQMSIFNREQYFKYFV